MTEARPVKQSVTLENTQYELEEGKVPMWYVFTTTIELDENIEAATIVIGPSTEDANVVIDYVKNQVASDFQYRGGFDHDPSEEELAQFAPEGYEQVTQIV